MTRIDTASLRRQIEALKVQYPELAEDDELLADTIEGETDAFEVLGRLVRDERMAKANAAAVGAYMADLAGRKARLERRQDAIRELMLSIMDAANLKKAALAEATLSVQAGRAKAVITDEAALPSEFQVVKTSPDRKAILDALKAGAAVPGAALANGEPTLTVRVA